MSKLSFRARALDAAKPMPVFMAEELPDLPDYSAINRAVPQMPSGMEKEEECEHHLQRAICTGLIIPTPEVTDMADAEAYDKIYPADYKLPRQLIHMQPFAMEQDIPDYDMDSEDEKWVGAQSRKMDLTPLQFEEMMDRLEKSSGQTVVTLNEAKALLKEDDDLIIAVFDYWLNKRLKTQHPLLLTVKTEHRLGSAANNPYLAFRRRTEKMQTRKNRKNDETSYEKMLKLRRDLSRAVTLLELVKRREKTKREHLHLTIEVYEKRYQAQDFNGQILAEVSALKTSRPAFAPLFTNQFGVHQNWANKVSGKDEVVPRKEKRQYKKRKHKAEGRGGPLDDGSLRGSSGGGGGRGSRGDVLGGGLDLLASSDDDSPLPSHSHSQPSLPSDRDEEDTPDEGQFAFRRNKSCGYLPPVPGGFGNWPWCERSEGGLGDKRFRFALTSISKPTPRCVGLARRRVGRGGRVILDRCATDMDDMWSSLDFTIHEPKREPADPTSTATTTTPVKKEWLHFRPKTPPPPAASLSESSSDSESEGEPPLSRSAPLPYPFPPEATAICVDVEPDRPGDEPPFTSEFNIADYFSVDGLADFDFAVAGSSGLVNRPQAEQRTDELGSSAFTVLPLGGGGLPVRHHRVPASVSAGTSENRNSVSAGGRVQTSTASTSTSTQACEGPVSQNHQVVRQHRQLVNNSAPSILSKSLTGPVNNRNAVGPGVRVFSGGPMPAVNFGNGHQNGPVAGHHHPPHHRNSNSLVNSNSEPRVNNQSMTTTTVLLPQKHPTSSILPGLIAQSKLASLARHQQQQQPPGQAQQVSTSGEITLNSNSEGLEMEVNDAEGSPCETKQQQQQLVRANKTNSLAMEVT